MGLRSSSHRWQHADWRPGEWSYIIDLPPDRVRCGTSLLINGGRLDATSGPFRSKIWKFWALLVPAIVVAVAVEAFLLGLNAVKACCLLGDAYEFRLVPLNQVSGGWTAVPRGLRLN